MKKLNFFLTLSFLLALTSCSPERSTYQVTFNSDGGSEVPTQLVNEGEKVSKPSDPTKLGYEFVNWTYQEEEWSFDTVVTSDITLLANWNIINYTITYDLNGGTNNPNNKTTYTVEDIVELYAPTKRGYNFAGWTLNDELISTLIKGTTGNLTLVATWNIIQYEVEVIYDESLGAVTGTGSYSSNESVTLVATANEDSVFKGWYDSDDNLLSDETTYTFLMPNYKVTYNALFWSKAKQQWYIDHGVIPFVDETNKTLTYGLYPQTVVDNTTLISELNNLTDNDKHDNGWYFYNYEYYAKIDAYPYDVDYEFSNGETIVYGKTYWFLCEAITWNILTNNEGNYYLVSNLILDNHCYYTATSSRTIKETNVSANNYEYSDIRAWLNGYNGMDYECKDYTDVGFLNKAFYLDSSYLVKTTVDNSATSTNVDTNQYACNNTEDMVYLPSYQDYINESYGFASSKENSTTRECKTTDYARALGSFSSTEKDNLDNGIYLTRSPSSDYSNHAWYVGAGGRLSYSWVDNKDYGIRPSISFKLS